MVMDHKNKYSDMYTCNTVMFVVILVLFLTSKSHGASIAKTSSGRYHGTSSVQPDIGIDSSCEQLPTAVLSEILGPAYNSRYMSIATPNKADVKVNRNKGGTDMKRMVSTFPPFYVDDDYALDLGDEPAWDVKYSKLNKLEPVVESDEVEEKTSRRKRAASRPWSCEAKIKWVDLGPDYFPRHLRTVECTQHDCWYGHYTCQPRSFAVRILRRRSGVCVNSDPMKKIGVAGLPGELRELWVWEERAVNFCCDCAAK